MDLCHPFERGHGWTLYLFTKFVISADQGLACLDIKWLPEANFKAKFLTVNAVLSFLIQFHEEADSFLRFKGHA